MHKNCYTNIWSQRDEPPSKVSVRVTPSAAVLTAQFWTFFEAAHAVTVMSRNKYGMSLANWELIEAQLLTCADEFGGAAKAESIALSTAGSPKCAKFTAPAMKVFAGKAGMPSPPEAMGVFAGWEMNQT